VRINAYRACVVSLAIVGGSADGDLVARKHYAGSRINTARTAASFASSSLRNATVRSDCAADSTRDVEPSRRTGC
jgi:hypothetical protein